MSKTKDPPATATCHRKAISITVPHLPEYLNACQCSICRRYSAAWAYYKGNEVKIKIHTRPDHDDAQITAKTADDPSDSVGQVLVDLRKQKQRPSPLSSASLGDATGVYVWGDKDIEFHFCRRCGCVTHWWYTGRMMPWNSMMGVNGRLFETDVLDALEIRKSAGPRRESSEAAPEVR